MKPNRRTAILLAAALLATQLAAPSAVFAQRRLAPRSFPPPEPAESEPPPGPGALALPELPPRDLMPPLPGGRAAPTEAELGVTIYPNSIYLTSYDAGGGQAFHLFGTNATFENMVRYYRVILRERGDRVFDAPATHQFDTHRFREDEMTFRPSVTIKDYAWNGSPGYRNPVAGADPPTFATIIQFTTAPPGARRR